MRTINHSYSIQSDTDARKQVKELLLANYKI